VTKVAKKKDKALKSLKKDVARLTKQNDKLAERLEKTSEDQAAELEEIRNLVEERD
jgi:prefoldin subunit 5